MSFSSFQFLLFLVVVFIVYFIVPSKLKWVVLLFASYFFYYLTASPALPFLIITTIVTFYTGIFLGRVNSKFAASLDNNLDDLTKDQKRLIKDKTKKEKGTILAISLIITFGILAFLKYFNFFALNTSALLNSISNEFQIPSFNLLLPLGISFYTFQSAGYIIDVYRGKIQPDRNLAKFALFVSFFPQIVQGPISRYDEIAGQLYTPHKYDYTRTKFGLQLILWGFFKKLVIADRAAVLVNTIFGQNEKYQGITLFFGAALYCIQIYSDFSGGIDIARGAAQVFGIDLPINFSRPLFATSVTDFWRRWHITLSSWMRDYLFYPLSLSHLFSKIGKLARKIFGNQLGKKIPTILAMFITFVIIGIWHGPNWKYVAYGIYNGLFIVLAIILEPVFQLILKKWGFRTENFGWRFLSIVFTFYIISLGRFFSRAPDLHSALSMAKRTLYTFNPWVLFDNTILELGLDMKDLWILFFAILVLLVVDLLQEIGFNIREKIASQNLIFRWSLYLSAIFAIIIFGYYGIQYKASDFIYMGF